MPKLLAVVALSVGLLAHAPAVAAQSGQSGQDEGERSGLRWRNRPSIQIGEHIRLDLRLKLQYAASTRRLASSTAIFVRGAAE
jgi:hypothetical protein